MELPHWEWLRSHLVELHDYSGGYETKMRGVLIPGAALVMSAVLVVAWLIALLPSLAWQLVRRRPAA